MSSANIRVLPKQYSGFDARSVPSCLLWFDAADTSTIVATGSSVTQWNDKSGNATHLTAVNSPQTGITTTNGLNTMNLTAGGYFTRTTGFTFPAQYSVFTVAFTNATGLTTLLSASGDLAFLYRTPNSILWGNGSGFWNTFTTPIPSAPLALLGFTNTGSAGTLYTNGSFRETVSGSTVARTQFAIGNRLLNLTEPYNGFVCEVMVFNIVISTGQRQAIEGYLARKWGLTGSLPTTHPYKSLPPFTRFFLPTDISDCTLWLDASDPNTITSAGVNITQWNDKSGNGFNATATSTPTRSTYNGYPVVSFNGSTQFMSSAHTVRRTAHTLIAVHRPAVINADRQGNTSLFRYQGPNNYIVFPYMNNTTPRGYVTNASASLLATNSPLVENSVTTAFNLIMAGIASGSQVIYKNGTVQVSRTFGLSLGTSDPLTIGRWGGGAAEYYQGDLAEMIVYNRNLATGERQLLEGYLAWKWGLQATLPATQPFKLFRSPTVLFNPLFISNCSLWLDAIDSSTLTLSGSTLTQWNDKSGGGFNATSPAGPTQSTYNGYPVLSFNGSSQYMVSANTVPRTTHTLIAVHRPATTTGNFVGNTSLFRYQNVSSYIVFPFMNGTTPRGYITDADGTPINSSNSTLLENSVTTSLNLIMAVIDSGSQAVFKNGVQQASTTQSLAGATSDTLTIGRYNPGSSDYYQGDLAEMIVYSRILTVSERRQMEGYLAWKWGLQATLSSSHPYYDTRS